MYAHEVHVPRVCVVEHSLIKEPSPLLASLMSHSHTPTHTVAAARDGHANTATVRARERKWSSVNLCEKSFLLIK